MIMSKKCSLCGSYNTERSVTGTANYALRQAGRFVIAGGASVVVGIFNKYAGRGVASGVWRNTENWVSGISQYYCCDCHKDFNACE